MQPYCENCPACGLPTPTRGLEYIHAMSHSVSLDQQKAEQREYFEQLVKEQAEYHEQLIADQAMLDGVLDDDLADYVVDVIANEGANDDLFR